MPSADTHMHPAVDRYLHLALQIGRLWLVSWAGHAAVDYSGLPLPGSVVSILLMFFLLQTGLIRADAVDRGADLLLRHLALYFIPIAAGMMSFWMLWLNSGLAILADLLLSAAVGFAVTGLLCQALARREPTEEPVQSPAVSEPARSSHESA